MAMEEYRGKRNFRITPEPEPGARTEKGSSFVVHRHEARNLHYDLRIQADGVLVCWAVPKGFFYAPADKRLAVRTEDHPMEYTTFEGPIPKGQYGAGTMRIWDSGEYEVKKSPTIAAALEKGELKLELKGRRLRGEWHLVRTKQGDGKNWLLFKARDRFVGSGSDLFGAADMSRARQKQPPRSLTRMEAAEEDSAFDDPAWFFEPLFVGKRVLARVDETSVVLRAGTGDLAPQFPRLAAALQGVRARTAIFDGIVVEKGGNAALYLFDILYAEEWDLRRLPLRERKIVLRSLLPESGALLRVDPIAERGQALAEAAGANGLPGIIGKKADSPYRAGASADWRVIRVAPGAAAKNPAKSSAHRRASSAPAPSGIAVTHPGKVYWPEQGYTKADLVRYYDRAANWLLPYLRDRPLHLYRWPDGIRGKSFYQKQLPPELLDNCETVDIAGPGEEPLLYAICNDRKALMTLINAGSIDLHPWLSRKGSLDFPDWAILDLDPKEAPFSSVIKIARVIGKLLRGLGIEPYLKTSGSTGLHVCIPLKKGYTFSQSRMFCEAIARLVVRDHGDLATVERSVGARGGKVYVDFLQNRREQTVVPPYVVRPVEAASVSMPVSWDELEGELAVADFTLANAPTRAERTGDLFRTALENPQDLAAAIDALEKHLRT
jgi:DNA ligase D-like protein (predicted polymerase)/DNA ligase D-like protein (predicted 3'-phosphoesterase)